MPPAPDLVTVNIDGRVISVPRGTNMIEAAAMLGIEIPHFCYHPKLSVAGNCRMCLVETGMPVAGPAAGDPTPGAGAPPKIAWSPKPAIACSTAASPGLHIRTTSGLVKQCREGVMEFLLVNHPLDCPICDQAGECRLQEHAADYGRGVSRYTEDKNVKPKRTRLGPRVMLDDERCILCSRCIRFCREIAKDDVLGFIHRGSATTLTCHPGRTLENNYSLNTVDICPVGALTSIDFRFKMRVWFLKQTPSIDSESSTGANTTVWSREGVIHRITPRRNDAVNDTWMPDSGRLLYKTVDAENRLTHPLLEGAEAEPEAVWRLAADLLRAGSAAVVGSGRSSVEEQFLTARLAAALKAPAWIVGRTGPDDGLLLSADRNPNTRGALATGLISALPSPALAELAARIDNGSVKTVLSVGEDLAAAGLTPSQLAKVSVILLATHRGPATESARVALPSLTIFEKDGSFINRQFRIQKFSAAVPGPTGAMDDRTILARLLEAAGGGDAPATLDQIWAILGRMVPALTGMTHATLPDDGLPIDPTPWAALPFPEAPALHHTPPSPERA